MKNITSLLILFFTSMIYSQTVFKLDSLHIFSWDEAGMEWNHNTRELYNYANADTLATNVLRLVSDDNGMTWGNATQVNNTYSGNYISESISQTWDGALWMNVSRDLYTYDSEDQLAVKENFLDFGIGWQVFQDNTYTYDLMGNEVSNTLRELDFVMFVLENKERWTYTYTGTRKDQDIMEEWTFANVWENDLRCDYFYDSNDILERKEERTWTNSDEWSDPFKRTFFEYDSNDLPDIITNQTFGSGTWNNTERTLNTFTSFNLTEAILQEWNSGNMGWDNSSRLVQTYDGNNNNTEQVFQEWESIGMVWENFLRTLYFWSEAEALSISEVLTSDLQLYPNPVVDYIKINFKTKTPFNSRIEVYDILGKKITAKLIKAGENSIELPMKKYKHGTYLIKINMGSYTQTYKVVKR